MIPIRDTIPSRGVGWMTRLLLAANLLAFIWEIGQGRALPASLYRLGVVPAHWMLTGPGDLLNWPPLFVSLLTSQFLHGGLLQLGANMLYLWIFGDNVEDRLGPGRFLSLYLGSGVLAAVTQLLMTPHSSVPMIGASGAIAGVLGAYLRLFPTARIITIIPMLFFFQTVELPAFVFLGFWFLLQWYQGVITIGQVAAVGGVAFWAHIGGFVGGMLGLSLLRR